MTPSEKAENLARLDLSKWLLRKGAKHASLVVLGNAIRAMDEPRGF